LGGNPLRCPHVTLLGRVNGVKGERRYALPPNSTALLVPAGTRLRGAVGRQPITLFPHNAFRARPPRPPRPKGTAGSISVRRLDRSGTSVSHDRSPESESPRRGPALGRHRPRCGRPPRRATSAQAAQSIASGNGCRTGQHCRRGQGLPARVRAMLAHCTQVGRRSRRALDGRTARSCAAAGSVPSVRKQAYRRLQDAARIDPHRGGIPRARQEQRTA